MLSPLDPLISWTHSVLALAHYFDDNYEQSIQWSQQVLSRTPHDSPAYRPMIAALVALGRTEEARDVARSYAAAAPKFRIGPFLERYPIRDSAALACYGERLLAAGLTP
jgi:hypothetical protein